MQYAVKKGDTVHFPDKRQRKVLKSFGVLSGEYYVVEQDFKTMLDFERFFTEKYGAAFLKEVGIKVVC